MIFELSDCWYRGKTNLNSSRVLDSECSETTPRLPTPLQEASSTLSPNRPMLANPASPTVHLGGVSATSSVGPRWWGVAQEQAVQGDGLVHRTWEGRLCSLPHVQSMSCFRQWHGRNSNSVSIEAVAAQVVISVSLACLCVASPRSNMRWWRDEGDWELNEDGSSSPIVLFYNSSAARNCHWFGFMTSDYNTGCPITESSSANKLFYLFAKQYIKLAFA